MDYEYIVQARSLLELCHAYEAKAGIEPPAARVNSVRALSTALAIMLRRVAKPGMLLKLVIRDLSEATRTAKPTLAVEPIKNVVDLGTARKRRRRESRPE